jgi:hypothetical protein
LIISASRRTDIPAFYGDWFRNRLKAGFCDVRNPFRPSQVRRVSMALKDVDAFVFWTRDPRAFLPAIEDLERGGFPFIFLVTITGYPPPLEPGAPPAGEILAAMRLLARRIGPERVVWRYDPVFLSSLTPPEFHTRNFSELATALEGSTRRVIVSVLDFYTKAVRRLNALKDRGLRYPRDPWQGEDLGQILRFIVQRAAQCGMEAVSCCEPAALPFGLRPGACIDADHLGRLFGLTLPAKKDPGQRPECLCAVSRDIGAHDTCPRGCAYCYATRSFEGARSRSAFQDPASPRIGE